MKFVKNRWLLLAAVLLTCAPIMIDLTILHIAIPSLTLDLNASGTQVLWIVDIYPLIMAGLLVPMGVLTDRIGTRRMLLIGMTVFMLASIGAAFSLTPNALIGARAILAVGSAMMTPPILAVIRRAFDDERERGVALGLWGTVAGAGAAAGPLIGGVLLEHFWWGSVFLINVPIMLLVAPIVGAMVPDDDGKPSCAPWPISQALLLMTGLILSVFAIKSIFKPDQSSATGFALLLIGLALLAIFTRLQFRSQQPMLDLSLFERPQVRVGLIMALIASGALAGVELTLAQEMQFVIGKTPLEAGLFLLPLMVAAAVGGPIAGWFVSVVGLRRLTSLALAASALSLAGLAVSDFNAAGLGVTFLLATLGLALSVGLTASSVAVMSAIPTEKAGSAGSLEATAYDLGTGLGITGFGVMLSAAYAKAITMPEDLTLAVAAEASVSIGETMIVASELPNSEAESLIRAAKSAFSLSHMIVLGSAATLLGFLAVVVCIMLSNQDKSSMNTRY